jgi:hypothetical protein
MIIYNMIWHIIKSTKEKETICIQGFYLKKDKKNTRDFLTTKIIDRRNIKIQKNKYYQ